MYPLRKDPQDIRHFDYGWRLPERKLCLSVVGTRNVSFVPCNNPSRLGTFRILRRKSNRKGRKGVSTLLRREVYTRFMYNDQCLEYSRHNSSTTTPNAFALNMGTCQSTDRNRGTLSQGNMFIIERTKL